MNFSALALWAAIAGMHMLSANQSMPSCGTHQTMFGSPSCATSPE